MKIVAFHSTVMQKEGLVAEDLSHWIFELVRDRSPSFINSPLSAHERKNFSFIVGREQPRLLLTFDTCPSAK
jgi:hypothetical protein